MLDDGDRVLPGEGVAPIAAYRDAILATGYRGYWTLELLNEDIWQLDVAEAAALSARAMNSFRKATQNEQIDKIDEKIIEFFCARARPERRDRKRLKTSEATVRRRRTRLEKEGLIKFVCAADPVRLGYESAAIIGVEARASHILHVEAELQKLDDVQFLGLSTAATTS